MSRKPGKFAWHGKNSRASGSALLIVLWTIILLSLIATSFVRTARVDARVARNAVDLSAARLLADAGAKQGMLALVEAQRQAKLASARPVTPDQEKRQLPLTDSQALLQLDGIPYAWQFGETEVDIAFIAEAGKINVNLASGKLLQAGFKVLGLDNPDILAAAVERYRKSVKDAASRSSPTAEFDSPQAEQLPIPFQSVEDMTAMLGFAHDVSREARDIFTVYSTSAVPELNLASPKLLAALLGPRWGTQQLASVATAMMSANRQALNRTFSAFTEPGDEQAAAGDGQAETAEDQTGDEQAEAEAEDAPAEDGRVEGGSEQGARLYTIRATAHSGGAVFVREAVVELVASGDMPFRIYRWSQGEVEQNEATSSGDGHD